MKITQVINNNVLCVISNGEEIIVMGKGIGFKANKGDIVDESKIVKTFISENNVELENFKNKIKNLSVEVMQITVDIIEYAKTIIADELSANVYITLTDHINNAVKYFDQNNKLINPLVQEIKYLHKQEFAVGLYAIKLLKEKYNVKMTEYEAGNIALHIVNSRFHYNDGEAVKIITLINSILKIITSYNNIELVEDSIDYKRFLIHLKYFAIRVVENIESDFAEDSFLELLKQQYNKEYLCSLEIKQFIHNRYNKVLEDQELVYFIMYINRLINTKKRGYDNV